MSPARRKATSDTTPCPWCSADVPAEAATCPSCGAALRDAVDGDVLGVTQVDIAATTKLARLGKPSRLATWLGAESTIENPDLAGRIEPPSEEVRKEMLRLELAAIDAELEAKRLAAEQNRKLEEGDGGANGETPVNGAAAEAGETAAAVDGGSGDTATPSDTATASDKAAAPGDEATPG